MCAKMLMLMPYLKLPSTGNPDGRSARPHLKALLRCLTASMARWTAYKEEAHITPVLLDNYLRLCLLRRTFIAWSSKRFRERNWHIGIPLILSGIGFMYVLIPSWAPVTH